MYTQCPDCSTAFRVTANDLKQAAGKVRCGGCGAAFDALEFLSETMPEQPAGKKSEHRLPELKPDQPDSGLPEAVSPEESIALLKTLDELAGSDIRIEDTGIEWRLLDDQAIAELETEDGAGGEDDVADADDDDKVDDTRYDDDTPVPEDSGESDASAPPEADAPEKENSDAESESDDEPDVDFDDDETGEWEEILEEVDETAEPAAEDDESDSDGDTEGSESDQVEDVSEPEEPEEPDEEDEADAELPEDEPEDEEKDGDSEAADDPDVQEVDTTFESIIMEGETVRSALDDLADGAEVTDADVTYWTPPEESGTPTGSTERQRRLATLALLLLLVLGLQVIHHFRETLATMPAVQRIIAPAYRAIGMPLSPDWDVTGWRFEATQGSANEENDELTVYSRIGNTSDKPLPYPLVGISLTDRFDETIGSRLLEPAEFLTGDANLRRLVPAGGTFDAVISIRSPDESATGYKLNVCYRDTGGASAGRLRCAIGDFKE